METRCRVLVAFLFLAVALPLGLTALAAFATWDAAVLWPGNWPEEVRYMTAIWMGGSTLIAIFTGCA